MPITRGDRLGPYEILAPIGKGGMGEVWKARNTRLNRTVAIKRLAEKHSPPFEREARAIAALIQAHMCTADDMRPDHLVMEHIGDSRLKGPVTAEEVRGIRLEMASAWEAGEPGESLHRDLKRATILVTTGGGKLLDLYL